jgi:hypothetical protein
LSEIANATVGSKDHIEQDAAFWRKANAEAADEHQQELLKSLLADEAQERLYRAAARQGIEDVKDPEFEAMPEQTEMQTFFGHGHRQARPFEAHLEEWLGTRREEQKISDMKRSNIWKFAEEFRYVSDVHRKEVQVDQQACAG